MDDELNNWLAHLNDTDVTWSFHLDSYLREYAQQTLTVGDAGDRTAETIGLS